jgi:outer membrane protein assembly factor BamB
MQDFEDDAIEISDLDTPDERRQSSAIYRMLKRVHEIHLAPKTRTIIFVVALLLGASILAYQLLATLRPKSITSASVYISSSVHVELQPVNPIIAILHANGIAYIFTVDGTLSTTHANDGTLSSQQASGGTLSAQRASDGKLLWHTVVSVSTSQPIVVPILADNLIFFASQNSKGGHVDAFRASDGALQWSFATSALASPEALIINDAVAYIFTQNKIIYALNTNNGHILWHFTTTLSDPLSTLLYTSNGVTAVRPDARTVVLLYTQDGAQLWHYTVANYRLWQPSIDSGIAYIQSSENVVQARNLSDGKFLWQYSARSKSIGSFTTQNGLFYVDPGNGEIAALSERDGAPFWQFKTSDGIQMWRIHNGFIFFISSNGYFGTLRALDGTLLWKFKASTYSNVSWFSDTPDGLVHILVNQPDIALYTLRISDGTVIWHQPLNNFDNNSLPEMTDTALYTRQSDGSIDAWRGNDGRHLWHYQPPAPIMQATAADSMLYMQQEDGTLSVLRVQDGKVAWAYPSATGP